MTSREKRVYCLYRTPGITDTDKKSAEQQRLVCEKFADKHGWRIIRSFCETEAENDDVSMYKEDALL